MMGEKAICEHVGKARGSELSRFRHSRRLAYLLCCVVLFCVVVHSGVLCYVVCCVVLYDIL